MGGMKKKSSQQSWKNTVNGQAGKNLQRVGLKTPGRRGSGHAGMYRQAETVITTLVGQVIGREIILHALLESADFAGMYPGKVRSASQPKQWNLGGVPFQASFLSHTLHYECQYLTIVSKGGFKTFDGRKTDLWMELSLERIGVSPGSAAIQWEKGCMPLVLNFDAGPETFIETAFSFDTDQESDTYGCSYSGCGFLTIINPKAGIPEHTAASWK